MTQWVEFGKDYSLRSGFFLAKARRRKGTGWFGVGVNRWLMMFRDQLQTDRVVFRTSDAALNTCASGGCRQALPTWSEGAMRRMLGRG